MYRSIILLLFFVFNVFCEEERVIKLDIGKIRGEKYWHGNFYEFYGVPYATAPKGRDKFKAPLPVEPWNGTLDANRRNIMCEQMFFEDDNDDDMFLVGVEDCLTMNLFVPEDANENNLVPVLVYIHSGAYTGGSSNMARFHYLARYDVIVIAINYRLGFPGFACLGTEEIPGNAGLKDQVAALKFIHKYIKNFGGDPAKITLAGFSVGASMAELISLSKYSNLIEKLILDSGSALNPFAINRDPVNTAINLARKIGYNGTDVKSLNEFLLNADAEDLGSVSVIFHLPNATLGLTPCVEKPVKGVEPFLTESPLDIFIKGDFKKVPVLVGFSNMEGISRTHKFEDWMDEMNENFSDFLPADLAFNNDKARNDFIEEIKKRYFKGDEVSHDTLQGFVDYSSDMMFKYGIMKSAKLHALKSETPVFLYEFTYVGKLNFKHYYMDKLKGASHRDQTAYLLDFHDFSQKLLDMDVRDRLTTMWTDFVKYEDPTAYESLLIKTKWPKYTEDEQKYMEIGSKLKVRRRLFEKQYLFWDDIHKKHYVNPKPLK